MVKKKKNNYCPNNETYLLSLVMCFFALGITLWGVIAIISGLLDNYYQELGYWITIGDIIVLLFSIAGCIFFIYMIGYFTLCNRRNNQSKKKK